MLAYLLFCVGLVLLVFGGDWLVKGAVALAEKFGISPLIIGLTIVAMGTSAPELVISLSAALSGSGSLAVGNVVGSNIANVLLVLGIPALFAGIVCADKEVHGTVFFLLGITLVFMLQLSLGPLSRVDGLLLLALLAAFIFQQYANAQRKPEVAGDYHDELGKIPAQPLIVAGLISAGLIALPLGAKLTVDAAVEIARRWAVSEEIIGLTVVAIGTSLPELATGIMAARRGNASVAIGNIVGSNIFNIAAIMGITATIAAPVSAGSHIVAWDMWVMLATTVLIGGLIITGKTVGKAGGLMLASLYAAYLVFTAVS